jgi:hypothetical protein
MRRETDTAEGISRIASDLIPFITKALDSHACQRKIIIDALSEGQAAMYDRAIDICNWAIQTKGVDGVDGVDGVVVRGKDAMDAQRIVLRRALASQGGA